MKSAVVVLTLALALAPSGAESQVVSTTSVFAGGAIPAVQRSLALPGISVFGSAQVRIPAQQVTISALAPGFSDSAEVLAMLRGAGVERPSLSAFVGFATNQAVLRGVVRNVSRAKLDALTDAVVQYVHAHPGAAIDNLQVYTSISGCMTREESLRAHALADAHRRAASVARDARAVLGNVIAVNESGGCSTADSILGAPVDVASLTATLGVTESVTYAILRHDSVRRRHSSP